MTVEVYTDPGTVSWESTKYVATINSSPAYVFGYSRTTIIPTSVWSLDEEIQASWLVYGADTSATVEISLLDTTPITSAVVYPKNITSQSIIDGNLILTVPQNVRLRVEINGDRKEPLNLLVNPLKDTVPTAKTDWTTLGKEVLSIDTSLNKLVFATPHGFSVGDKITVQSTSTNITVDGEELLDTEIYYAAIGSSGNDLFITREDLSAVGDITGSGFGTITVYPAKYQDTINTLYFPAGIHTIGRLFDLTTDTNVYIDEGAVVIGSFDLRGCDNILIQGPGTLSGSFTTREEIVNTYSDFYDKAPYSMFYGYDGSKFSFSNSVKNITIIASPFYLSFEGVWSWRNCYFISPWTWNSDGFGVSAKSSIEQVTEIIDCFTYCGDDAIKIAADFDNVTVSGCFSVNSGASCFLGYYWSSISNLGYTVTIEDCDAMHLGIADSDNYMSGYPIKASQCILKSFTDGYIGAEDKGHFNVSIDGLRVWGPLNNRLFCLGNRRYAYVEEEVRDQRGQIAFWDVQNVTTEFVPGQKSILLGLDSINTPHDLTFSNINLGENKVTFLNYLDYFEISNSVYNLFFDSKTDTVLDISESSYNKGLMHVSFSLRNSRPLFGDVHEGFGEWVVYNSNYQELYRANKILDFGWVGSPGDVIAARFVDKEGSKGEWIKYFFTHSGEYDLNIYVDSSVGNDSNIGSIESPIRTVLELRRRLQVVRSTQDVAAWLKEGQEHNIAEGYAFDNGNTINRRISFRRWGSSTTKPILSSNNHTLINLGTEGSLCVDGVDLVCNYVSPLTPESYDSFATAVLGERTTSSAALGFNIIIRNSEISLTKNGVFFGITNTTQSLVDSGKHDFVAFVNTTFTDSYDFHIYGLHGVRKLLMLNTVLNEQSNAPFNSVKIYGPSDTCIHNITNLGVNSSILLAITKSKLSKNISISKVNSGTSSIEFVGEEGNGISYCQDSRIVDCKIPGAAIKIAKADCSGAVNSIQQNRFQVWDSIAASIDIEASQNFLASSVTNDLIDITNCGLLVDSLTESPINITLNSNQINNNAITIKNCLQLFSNPSVDSSSSFIKINSSLWTAQDLIDKIGYSDYNCVGYVASLTPNYWIKSNTHSYSFSSWKSTSTNDLNSISQTNTTLDLIDYDNPDKSLINLRMQNGTGPQRNTGTSSIYYIDQDGYLRDSSPDIGPFEYDSAVDPDDPEKHAYVVLDTIDPIIVTSSLVSSINISVILESEPARIVLNTSAIDSVLVGLGVVIMNSRTPKAAVRIPGPLSIYTEHVAGGAKPEEEIEPLPPSLSSYYSFEYTANQETKHTTEYLDLGFTTEDNILFEEKEFIDAYVDLNKVNGDVTRLNTDRKKVYTDNYIKPTNKISTLQKITNTTNNYARLPRTIDQAVSSIKIRKK
jgi:hypothetical protein